MGINYSDVATISITNASVYYNDKLQNTIPSYLFKTLKQSSIKWLISAADFDCWLWFSRYFTPVTPGLLLAKSPKHIVHIELHRLFWSPGYHIDYKSTIILF